MQIHHVERAFENEHVLDPTSGKVRLKRTPLLGPSAIRVITFDQDVYSLQPDGCFEVPADVGHFYLKQDGWFQGENPFAARLLAEHQAEQATASAERKADEERAKKEEAEKAAAEKASASKSPAK